MAAFLFTHSKHYVMNLFSRHVCLLVSACFLAINLSSPSSAAEVTGFNAQAVTITNTGGSEIAADEIYFASTCLLTNSDPGGSTTSNTAKAAMSGASFLTSAAIDFSALAAGTFKLCFKAGGFTDSSTNWIDTGDTFVVAGTVLQERVTGK
jgi:hypothetical protein